MAEEETKPYFAYQLLNRGAVFIGNDKGQIKRTIDYYVKRGDQNGIIIPEEKDILELIGDVNITVVLPFAGMNQNISARVTPRAVFHVNANAINYIRGVASNYERLKRGELFKFEPGVRAFGLWFLPEDIMQGLRNYNWQQHESQVKEWLCQRNEVLERGRRKGILDFS